jgi:holo-[acyl-carrier protein] synthase
MIGIGIDLLEIARMEQALERRPRLAERVFTSEERAYAEKHARPAQHFAARFCAKESVAKALDLRAWAFRDIEVVATGVAETAQELNAEIKISLTHSDLTAGAVAVAMTAGAR